MDPVSVSLPLWVAVILSMNHKEYDCFDTFLRYCSKPLLILTVLCILAAIFHLFFSIAAMDFGGPEFRDGAYLLTYKSREIRELTREEFLRFRRIEARMMLCFPTVFSLIALTYFSARISRPANRKTGAND